LDRAAAMLVHMEIEPRRKRPWSPWQYMVLVVIALLIAVFCLGPLGRLVISPFQAISSALSGQQR
jgi:hypothetical protein